MHDADLCTLQCIVAHASSAYRENYRSYIPDESLIGGEKAIRSRPCDDGNQDPDRAAEAIIVRALDTRNKYSCDPPRP